MIKQGTIREAQQAGRELGIVRIGEKRVAASGKTFPAARDTFRITSAQEEILKAVQVRYGGELRPWAERRDHWELLTDVNEIRIMVKPTACLSQWYEQWSGGGCTHRCDGETVMVRGRDGIGVEKPCMCDPDNPKCKPTSRFSFMLSDVPILGVWRLNSGGKIFAQEASDYLGNLISLGMGDQWTYCILSVRMEEMKKPGQSPQRFAIPGVTLDPNPPNFPTMLVGSTVAGQLARQSQQVAMLESGAGRRQIEAPREPVRNDDGSIEAEVIDTPGKCSVCEKPCDSEVVSYSMRTFGRVLCWYCQRGKK